jgi:hypothetical protein
MIGTEAIVKAEAIELDDVGMDAMLKLKLSAIAPLKE